MIEIRKWVEIELNLLIFAKMKMNVIRIENKHWINMIWLTWFRLLSKILDKSAALRTSARLGLPGYSVLVFQAACMDCSGVCMNNYSIIITHSSLWPSVPISINHIKVFFDRNHSEKINWSDYISYSQLTNLYLSAY